MKTNIRGGIFYLTKYLLFFFIILVQSCASTSAIRLEGSDFEENLPGLWEGKWYYQSYWSGQEHIKITGIDGNKVHLTGFYAATSNHPDTEEVYGRIENSTLFRTWPVPEVEERYKLIRDDSNNLILDGHWKGKTRNLTGTVQFKKIE